MALCPLPVTGLDKTRGCPPPLPRTSQTCVSSSTEAGTCKLSGARAVRAPGQRSHFVPDSCAPCSRASLYAPSPEGLPIPPCPPGQSLGAPALLGTMEGAWGLGREEGSSGAKVRACEALAGVEWGGLGPWHQHDCEGRAWECTGRHQPTPGAGWGDTGLLRTAAASGCTGWSRQAL